MIFLTGNTKIKYENNNKSLEGYVTTHETIITCLEKKEFNKNTNSSSPNNDFTDEFSTTRCAFYNT